MSREWGSGREPSQRGEELKLCARAFLAKNMFTISNPQVGYMQ